MNGHEQANSIESPLMRIFAGKFRSTARASNQPDTITVDDIQVRFPSSRLAITSYVLMTDIEALQKHDSVRTVEDALARISHPSLHPVQLGHPSGFGAPIQQMLIEVLPPVPVLYP
jgi:ubiquitin carboxyl-terminal hydrolase 10